MFPTGESVRSCKVILMLAVVLIPADASSNPVVSRFDNLLKAIDKTILYSVRNYRYMNFDGVFGLWIAEEYLKYILAAPYIWEENPVVDKLETIKKHLSETYSSLRNVLPDVVESIKRRDIKYFQRMGSLLELDWSPHPPSPLLDVGTLVNLPKNQTTFDEELSDRCISQLLVSNTTTSRCHPSVDCLELITGSPSHGYELTHQILYIAVVMQLGCTVPFTAILEPRGMDLLIRSENLCSYTYLEMISLLRLESLTARHRDLLMEQIFVCAHMGFVQFDQLPLLDMILSWQHPSGCFTDDVGTPHYSQSGVGKRRLSEEHRLPDGCLSHLTSVATAALMTFLRRFLLSTTDIAPGEMDFRQTLINAELSAQEKLLPDMIQAQKNLDISSLPLDTDWWPSVAEDRLVQLTQLHQLTLWQPFLHAQIRAGAHLLANISEVDSLTSILFSSLSFLSLCLCALICLRYRRRLCSGKCDCV